MKNFRYINNTATLKLDSESCVGCGNCQVVCPHRIFELIDKKAVIRDFDACMECGACSVNCPVGAIRVNPGVGCAEAYINSWIQRLTGRQSEGGCC